MSSKPEVLFLDDKDISLSIGTHGSLFYFSVYNDKTNKAVATEITRQKLRELITLLQTYLENN